MAEILGEGKIVVGVEDNVRAELTKTRAEVRRAMEAIDGEEAVLRIDANTKEFYAKVRKAQADLDRWEHEKATATLDVDTRRANAGLANAKGRLKRYEQENVRVFQRIQGIDRKREASEERMARAVEKGEQRIAAAKQKAADQAVAAAERTARANEQAAARRAKAEEQVQRRIDRISRQGMRVREQASRAAEQAAQREATARQKTLDNSSKLERRYVDMIEKRRRLEKRAGSLFLPKSEKLKINFDMASLEGDMAKIRAELATIGKPPPEVDIHFNNDERGAKALSKWIDALSGTTVRLGPFTSTIAGAVRALATLGPAVMGVVGALGALAAAVGAAAIGFGGALTAGVGAFGLVLGSTAGLLPGLLRDFKNLNTLQDAYHKQVLKTGAGSDKAKTKLKEFNHALGEVSPSARAAFTSFDKLQTSYRNLAQKSRTPFLETLNEGFTTANSLLKRFGPEATQSFAMVAGGAQKVARALRGAEATNMIQTLFDQGQRALPSFGRGLGNLAVSLARVGVGFSRMLTPLGKGFEAWTKNFTNFTSNGSKLTNFVNKTTAAMQSLGHLLQATGRFLITFFKGGVESGVGLIDKLTGGINRLTASMQKNPQGISDFFGNSVQTAEKLFGVIGPLVQLFVEWATIMRPLTNIALDVLGAFSGLLNEIANFGPARDLIAAAFSIFIAGSIISKIASVTSALAALVSTMREVGAASSAMKIGSALSAGALTPLGTLGTRAAATSRELAGVETAAVTAASARTAAPRAVGGAASREARAVTGAAAGYAATGASARAAAPAVEKTAVAMTRGARAAGVLRTGLTGVGAVLGVANPVFGAAALGAVGLGTAYYFASKRSRDAKENFANTSAAVGRTRAAYKDASDATADLASSYQRSNLIVRQARRDLAGAKKGTDDYKLAQLNLNDAIRARDTAHQQSLANQKETVRLADEEVDRTKKLQASYDAANKGREKLNKQALTTQGPASKEYKNALADQNRMQAERAKLAANVTTALNKQAAATLTNARAMKGFSPLAAQAQQQLGSFARQAGKASATKIAVNFRSGNDAGKVAAAAGNAIKRGVPKSVATRIAVSTGDAEASIKRLNSYKITPKKLKIVEDGGRKAVAMVQELTGLKLGPKRQKIVEEGGAKALGVLAQILGVNLTPKDQKIAEQGSGAVLNALGTVNGFKLNDKSMTATAIDRASGIIAAIIGAINSIPASRTSTITTIYNTVHREDRVPGKGHFAQGGVIAAATGAFSTARLRLPRSAGSASYESPALTQTIGRAIAEASGRQRKVNAGGQVVRQPSLVVGEQRAHPEYVIATNPAFRNRNVKLLGSAARRFGMNLVQSAANGTFSGTGYAPSMEKPNSSKLPYPSSAKTLTRGKNKKLSNKKRVTKTRNTRRAWFDYVDNLKVRQSELEREVDIRESQVREPEEMVVQSGIKTVKDPSTGENVNIPTYAPNPKIESEYKPDLKAVLDAFAVLRQVIFELMNAIPKALAASSTERTFRNTAIGTLNNEIEKERNRMKGSKGDARDKHDKRIKDLTDERDGHKDIVKELTQAEKDYASDRVDAGFDYRETGIAEAKVRSERDSASGNAAADAAAQSNEADPNYNAYGNPQGGGGAGGSGGSGGDIATIGQQAGLADTERARIASTYGGNIAGVTLAGAASTAINAMANAAGLSPSSGAGLTDKFTGGIFSTSAAGFTGGAGGAKSAMAAFAGGALAGSAMGATGPTIIAGGGAAGGGGTVNTTTIVNNFQQPPADPLTWSKGIEFELGATV